MTTKPDQGILVHSGMVVCYGAGPLPQLLPVAQCRQCTSFHGLAGQRGARYVRCGMSRAAVPLGAPCER